MDTTENQEFDYYLYAKANPPDTSKIQRGTEAREKRLEAASVRNRIRIDQDILKEFELLAPHVREREQLINRALREWISARGVKELVRRELSRVIRETLESSRDSRTSDQKASDKKAMWEVLPRQE